MPDTSYALVVMTKRQLQRLQREREGLAAQLASVQEQLRNLGPRESGSAREDPDVQREELTIQGAELRRRLGEVDDQLANPQLIPRKKGSGQVGLGSRVMVQFLTGSQKMLTVNITENSNPSVGTIGRQCELAKALLLRRAGEMVEFEAGRQTHRVKILAVQ